MVTRYAGFPSRGAALLADLSKHNTAAWFRDHKPDYDTFVKRPFIDLVECVNDALADFAPEYRAAPPKGVSRPNRDTRFSKDKSPYRTDIAIAFPCRQLEKQLAAGFYLRVRADGADVIGGVVVPGPEQLERLRKFVASSHAMFSSAIRSAKLKTLMGPLRGEQLKRVPAGYDKEHPASDLLRRKQFYFERALPRTCLVSPRLFTEAVASLRAMTPFVRMLDEALGNQR